MLPAIVCSISPPLKAAGVVKNVFICCTQKYIGIFYSIKKNRYILARISFMIF